MDSATFIDLATACAPQVHPITARALVSVESGFNPWAIGVVGATLTRQPRSRGEALSTARALQASGWDFSVGLAQINVRNFARLGLTLVSSLDACQNLAAMQTLLLDCFERARAPPHRVVDPAVEPAPVPAAQAAQAARDKPPKGPPSEQRALQDAMSCYFSGNFTAGYRQGYVRKVVWAGTALAARAARTPRASLVAPAKETP